MIAYPDTLGAPPARPAFPRYFKNGGTVAAPWLWDGRTMWCEGEESMMTSPEELLGCDGIVETDEFGRQNLTNPGQPS